MKFPSIKTLASGAANTVKHFPAELLFALAGTIAFTIKIHYNYNDTDEQDTYTRVMMAANLVFL